MTSVTNILTFSEKIIKKWKLVSFLRTHKIFRNKFFSQLPTLLVFIMKHSIFRIIILRSLNLPVSVSDVIEELKLSNWIIKISKSRYRHIVQCQNRKWQGNARYATDAYISKGHTVLERIRKLDTSSQCVAKHRVYSR